MKSLLLSFSANTQKAMLVFGGTLVSFALLFLLITTQMHCMAKGGMKPYHDADALIKSHMATLQKPALLPQKYFTLLKTQQKVMNTRKAHHLDLALIFFRNYYAVLVLSMVLSCIGGVTLFILINRGWSGAGPVLKAFFLALVLALTFCGFFPMVFKQEENFGENMKFYMDYTKGELAIVDQLSLLENPTFGQVRRTDSVNKKPVTTWVNDTANLYHKLDSMVAINGKTINGLTNYVLTMDATKIKSMSDVYRMISNYQSGGSDSIILKK